MFAYFKGEITYKSATFITLEVQGIGYLLYIPLSTYSAIQNLDKATIYTYFHVKEDAQTLYGFYTQTEKTMFERLISVSGVGPNTALIMLSSMSVDEIRGAILADQASILQQIKGIGAKTAKQIILDLKDKMTKEAPDVAVLIPGSSTEGREEALLALIGLGFNKIQVQKALKPAVKQEPRFTTL